jgi:hypothetical protein
MRSNLLSRGSVDWFVHIRHRKTSARSAEHNRPAPPPARTALAGGFRAQPGQVLGVVRVGFLDRTLNDRGEAGAGLGAGHGFTKENAARRGPSQTSR